MWYTRLSLICWTLFVVDITNVVQILFHPNIAAKEYLNVRNWWVTLKRFILVGPRGKINTKMFVIESRGNSDTFGSSVNLIWLHDDLFTKQFAGSKDDSSLFANFIVLMNNSETKLMSTWYVRPKWNRKAKKAQLYFSWLECHVDVKLGKDAAAAALLFDELKEEFAHLPPALE